MYFEKNTKNAMQNSIGHSSLHREQPQAERLGWRGGVTLEGGCTEMWRPAAILEPAASQLQQAAY